MGSLHDQIFEHFDYLTPNQQGHLLAFARQAQQSNPLCARMDEMMQAIEEGCGHID